MSTKLRSGKSLLPFLFDAAGEFNSLVLRTFEFVFQIRFQLQSTSRVTATC